MNKIVLILIFFIISCSKNSNINSSNSGKVIKEESIINKKNIKKESKSILVNFNENVIFNLPSKINTVKFSYLKNNMGRHNYKINNKNFTKYKFKKISNFKQYEPNLALSDKGFILSDGKGSLIKYDYSKKIIWKKNYYSKKEKKLDPLVFLEKKNNILLASDSLANYYRIDPKNGNLIWKKINSSPFNSEIKIFKDKFYVVDLENKIHCFSIKDGKKIWTYVTENFFIKSKKKLSITIDDGKVFFNNTIGDITAVSEKNGDLLWQLPTQNNLIFGETILLRNSDLVIDKNSIYFSNNYNKFYSLDKNSGSVNWIQNIKSDLRPQIIENSILSLSNEGFLFLIDAISGNIIKSVDLFETYKSKKRKKLTPVGVILGLDKIYITLNDGKLLVVNISDFNLDNEIKIDRNIISRPFINKDKLLILSDSSVIQFN